MAATNNTRHIFLGSNIPKQKKDGRFGIAASSAYVSSKFAVEGLSESMSYELEPFGIRTIIIVPGVIKTNFIKSAVLAKKSRDPKSPYIQIMKGMESGMAKLIENAGRGAGICGKSGG